MSCSPVSDTCKPVSAGLHATAVHPGGIATALARHMDPAVVQTMMTPELVQLMKSPEQGAATTVWAAVSKTWEGTGGATKHPCSRQVRVWLLLRRSRRRGGRFY